MDLKKQKFIQVILLSFLVSNAWSQDICKLGASSFEKKIKINRIPGFFFKVHPEGKFLSYIGTDHNLLLDLDSGKELKTVGVIDPVWTQDGKYLTTPIVNVGEAVSKLNFYKTEDVIKATHEGKTDELKGSDSGLPGVYQSIGRGDDGYKVITDFNRVSVASYNPIKGGIASFSTPCGNIDQFPTDLPMLSRDGKYLSVFDQISKTTKIYNIENADDCKLAVDLGVGTGKVSFNYDSTQIAFHVDQFSDFESGYFSGISKDKVKNVVVVNLSSAEDGQKLIPESWALASSHVSPGDGGYYPDFDKEGNIYYLEDEGNYFQFVKTNPKLLEFRSYNEAPFKDQVTCVDCAPKANDAYENLAIMWSHLCSNQSGVNLAEAKTLIMSIDPVLCQKMVEDFWTPSLSSSKEELKKICPSKIKKHGESLGEWNTQRATQAQELIKARCLMCHRKEISYEVEEKFYVMTSPSVMEEKTEKVKKTLPPLSADPKNPVVMSKMMNSISPVAQIAMPLGNPLDAAEKSIMTDYFYRKMLDVPRDVFNSISQVKVLNRYDDAALAEAKKNMLGSDPSRYPQSLIDKMNRMMDCTMAGKNCEAYFKDVKFEAEVDAHSKPESERAEYVQNYLMQKKCDLYYEVTQDLCLEWRLRDYL